MPRALTATLIVAALLWTTGNAFAQQGQIAGTVRDPSGAVLPGVLVEVTSPALIEKVRSATSDDSGQYRITNLKRTAQLYPAFYIVEPPVMTQLVKLRELCGLRRESCKWPLSRRRRLDSRVNEVHHPCCPGAGDGVAATSGIRRLPLTGKDR